MKRILSIISLLLLAEIGTAQDPGIRDTVRFGDWGVYLPCPPCSGIATVPIFVYHDEYLHAMEFYLKRTGPIRLDDVVFTSEIDSFFKLQNIAIDTTGPFAIIWLYPDPLDPPPSPFPPGSRVIGYFVILVEDTGAASIDTFTPEAPPNPPITFWTPEAEIVSPSFYTSPFHLVPQNIKPSDANGDGSTSLVDIIYFVNYIFKNGSPPVNKQMSDVNLDCALNIEDLIFLVNYIFKSGPKPLPSWCSELAAKRFVLTKGVLELS